MGMSENTGRIGERLVRLGLLSLDEVEQILAQQAREGSRFCSIAVRNGWLTERQALKVLSEQHGCATVRAQTLIRASELNHPDLRVLSLERGAVPFRRYTRTMMLAMPDLASADVLAEFESIHGGLIRPVIALQASIDIALTAWRTPEVDAQTSSSDESTYIHVQDDSSGHTLGTQLKDVNHHDAHLKLARRGLRQALACIESGEWLDATHALTEVVNHDPFDVRSQYYLGMAFAQMNRYKDARRALERALALEPTFFPALLCLATVFEHLGQRKDALTTWRTAAAHADSSVALQMTQARITALST